MINQVCLGSTYNDMEGTGNTTASQMMDQIPSSSQNDTENKDNSTSTTDEYASSSTNLPFTTSIEDEEELDLNAEVVDEGEADMMDSTATYIMGDSRHNREDSVDKGWPRVDGGQTEGNLAWSPCRWQVGWMMTTRLMVEHRRSTPHQLVGPARP